ncbi:MAG: chromate transporter [Dehalococcoidia bacterium]|nr:chromate transporter [Dehalococcoidia bacterium]
MSELLQIVLVFIRVTVVAFGGGIGILPEMERLVVGEHHWVTHQQFVDAFALSQVTPGPGMLMVVAIGYKAAGIPGAVTAGLAMFLPTSLLSWFIADRWSRLNHHPIMRLLRSTLAPVALGLLTAGAYTLFRIGVSGPLASVVGIAAFVAVATFNRAPWQVVALGAVAGAAVLR